MTIVDIAAGLTQRLGYPPMSTTRFTLIFNPIEKPFSPKIAYFQLSDFNPTPNQLGHGMLQAHLTRNALNGFSFYKEEEVVHRKDTP